MIKNLISFSLIFIFLLSCVNWESDREEMILIKGATILNQKDDKGNYYDIQNGYILLKKNEIVDFGEFNRNIEFPANTKLIDATDKYVIPGLIDGFAVLNNQSYANAFLYKGITSIIGVDGGRRGLFYAEANPSPDFYRLESIGDSVKPDSDHLQDLLRLYDEGYKIALLKYKLTPGQVEIIHREAKKLGMGTIGELGYTSYKEGIEIGLDAVVHTTRYSLDVAPEELRKAVAEEPFSDDPESAKWKYYRYLYLLDTANLTLHDHSRELASGKTFLIPTFSLLSADLPGHKNPWDDPVAQILKSSDINNPVDPETGNHLYTTEMQEKYTMMALQQVRFESIYRSSGCRYLAGSATDVWGTMPGISLHSELEMLARIGLSHREVISAATTNFAEAFGWKTGKIVKGYEADILILDKNPLDDLANLGTISHLFSNGKEIELSKLIPEPPDGR